MCDYKVDEHKMTQADVRRVAREMVWGNTLSALSEDPEAIVSLVFTNTPYHPWGDVAMYWQPDTSHEYNDFHQVTNGQFARVVAEVEKQTERIRKLLKVPAGVTEHNHGMTFRR